MKKYLPIICLCGLFSGVIFYSIFNHEIPLLARGSSLKETTKKYLELSLKNTVFKTVDNTNLEKDFYKKKIIVLNFWASWCQPCLVEFPSLNSLQSQFKRDQLLVIGVNTDDENQVRNFNKIRKQYNLNFTHVLEKNNFYTSKFQVEAIPLSLVFYDGKLIQIHKGSNDFVSGENINLYKKFLAKQ